MARDAVRHGVRAIEAFGEVRKAISLVKRRTGFHESTVRELRIAPEGPRVGRELREFQGVLTGRLEYTGGAGPLIQNGDATAQKKEPEIA